MALKLDIIGEKLQIKSFVYDQDTVILYALGVGAGVNELDFIYEKNLKVLPTFAVIPYISAFIPFIEKMGLNLYTVLHGEQKIILHKPILPSGRLEISSTCNSVYDKGDKGAFVNLDIVSRDESGELVFENKVVVIDRGGGNFGGERGPKTEKIAPPEGQKPDFQVEYVTSPEQAALYRLNGDKNPLHIDPEFAKVGGFDTPILHGLCTFGFAGRAILHSVCDSDPSRFKSFAARFTGVVYPGETIITEGWETESGKYIIRCKTKDGREVLGNAVAEVD